MAVRTSFTSGCFGWVLVLLLMMIPRLLVAQDGADRIRLNQVGFYPVAPKVAVVVEAPAGAFFIQDETGRTVFTGTLSSERFWSGSGETVRQADFSAFQQAGTYVLAVPDVGTSHPFAITAEVLRPVAVATLKGYYYQRASTALPAAYAGAWSRPAGHPDTAVRVHASAATAERPAGTLIAAPRGWYDAGDFNKYIVNSGISTYTLLALYEHYPVYAETLATHIPESDNSVPDVLDEALWNLRWMLAMQDPNDGGVYHKLTHASFSGAVMPHQALATRYVVQKSTAATLDFAAVMAQAARLYDDFSAHFPGLADSMRTAALDAWAWARRHPSVAYNQNVLNQTYEPDIQTGEYGDGSFGDEFAWSAAELYVTTQADSFLTIASPLAANPDVPWWGGVRALAWYTLLHHRRNLPASIDTTALRNRYLVWASGLAARRPASPYGVLMMNGDFYWGSNAVAANQGMALLQAFRITSDSTYLWAALSNLDYLLGRNATGYSFVTGLGAQPPLHPHHRQSEADAVAAPVPGLLAGGPNPGQQDGCTYISNLPARSYLDDWCSYASNEIAINWNAPLAYLAGGIEAALGDGPTASSRERPDTGALSPGRLLPPYPNPAYRTTTLDFSLDAAAASVQLEAFDVLGRRVAEWGPFAYPAGLHQLTWPLSRIAGGLYLVRLVVGGQVTSRQVLIVAD